MKLINPTENRIEIQYKGDKFSVDANSSTEELSNEVAEYWLTIHEFLKVEEKAPVKKVVEKKEEKDKTIK